MPIQKSTRGLPISSAAFESAWETHLHRFGYKGLNLIDAVDHLEPDELSRMTNVTHRADGGLTGRAGLVSLSTGGTEHHSIRRLNDPTNATWTRFHGIDTALYRGQSGVLTSTDTGYSGDPLTLVPYRVALTGQTWMFVADSDKMRKVYIDGTVKEIGLPAPENAPTLTLQDPEDQVTYACSFENMGNDGTNSSASEWSFSSTGTASDNVSDIGGAVAVQFEMTGVGSLIGVPIPSFWGIAFISRTLDMSVLTTSGGDIPASDDDLIRFIAQVDNYQGVEEIIVTFLCNASPNAAHPAGFGDNTDGFSKTFTPADFNIQLDSDSRYVRFSEPGQPVLRRGDFVRFGSDPARGWDTITGLLIQINSIHKGSGVPNTDTISAAFDEIFMIGGNGPDSSGGDPIDYVYTNYDPTTGAESNPSPATDAVDNQRIGVTIDPEAFGDATIRQKIYRRGGTLVDNWYFVGTNSADGGTFLDELSDDEIALAGTVETDNFQPVPTVDENGDAVLAQPLPALWGPLEDFLFACGDPYRPGHVYFCKRGRPDAWPDTYITEVCSASEELMMGGVWGGQSFVFSKERMYILYPNLSGDEATVTSVPTQCKKGMVNRWGLAIGSGAIWFVSRDGIYRTSGGPEEWISRKIDPLFRGKTVNGYAPIDFSAPEYIRLELHENELWFLYRDSSGNQQVMIYNVLLDFWRHYDFGVNPACMYSDEGNAVSTLLVGGVTGGDTFTHSGTADDGVAIAATIRTGTNHFGRPREEKLLGDQILDVNTNAIDITLTNYVNDETTTNSSNVLSALAGRKRAVYDNFGTNPQHVRNVATGITWSASATPPVLYQLGTSCIVEPEITINRATQWDDLGSPDESYLTGVTFDCDTNGENRTIIVEYDYNGSVATAASLTVNTSGRRKVKFSFAAVQANKVRLRPNDDCLAWILYKVDWIAQAEPPRIARWDSHFENGWDQYYTGLDLFCDTGGQDKTVEVYVDGTLITTATVNTNGRKVHHITLTPGRGHVFRFVATDNNAGILYDYRWHTEVEPSETANWNQNFTVAGTEGDKYLKAIVLQCDTFGQDKTVTIEADGATIETLTVNTNGRKVVQFAFEQSLGRVFRLLPTDSNPGRLYSVQWIFDQEPLSLERWETQEITHGFAAWHYPLFAHVTLKSTAEVNLAVTSYNQAGTATTTNYTISSTGGNKHKVFVPFSAGKGVLYKYVLTSDEPFWLYREETTVAVREWGTDVTIIAHPFGNDNLDPTRVMSRSELSASRGGGTA